MESRLTTQQVSHRNELYTYNGIVHLTDMLCDTSPINWMTYMVCFFFFQAEDGIRDVERSRGLGDVYKRQDY